MRPSRLLSAALVASLALVATGCGGGDSGENAASGSGGVVEGATFVPAGAPGFVYLNTDFDSSQWQALDALLQKFPDREQLLSMLRSELSDAGVTWEEITAALGPETDVGVLTFQGENGEVVALTQAKDVAKLNALIAKLDAAEGGPGQTVKEEVDGWTLLSNSQAALDKAKQAHEGESLADSDSFKEAMGDLSPEALVKVYLDGAALTKQLSQQGAGAATSLTGGGTLGSVALDLTSEDDGLSFHVHVRTEGGTEPTTYEPALIDEVPSGALLYASFKGLGGALEQASSTPQIQAQLGMIQGLLGISVSELGDLLDGEGAVYVRQGAPIPEITFVMESDDPSKAVGVVDRLALRLGALSGGQAGRAVGVTLGGVKARKLSLGNFAIYYAGFDGKLVVSSAATGITGLTADGPKLADDEAFKAAKEAAGMPDETAGFVYVNLNDAVPLLDSFAQTAGEPLPPHALANLDPLSAFVAYATAEKGKASVTGFLALD